MSLENEAREAKISVNSLVASILERHNEWDKVADKFGFVHISGELFRRFLESIDDDDLASMAREFGMNMSTDLIIFWFKEVNLESVKRYLSLLAHYEKLFTLDFTELRGNYVIIAHHNFGEKGSIWFLNMLRGAIESNLDVTTSVKHTKTSVKIEIPIREFASAVDVVALESSPVLRRPR